MAYIARHGFPGVAPGDHSWQSQALYETATTNLALMGAVMGTDPSGGTGINAAHAGAQAWLGSNLGLFTVDRFTTTSGWAPTISHLAAAAVEGKLVSFMYGRYIYLGENGDTAFVAGRTGGHHVALVEAQRSGGTIHIAVRDPADDPDKPDPDNPQGDDNPNYLFDQSKFSRRVFDDARQIHVISPTHGFDRTMTALRYPLSDPEPGESKLALIDSFLTIAPKYGLTFENTDTVRIVKAISSELLGSFGGDSLWEIDEGLIVDLLPSPDDSRFTFVHQIALAPQTATIQALDPATGGIRVIDQIPAASQIVFGRKRELYVLQKISLDVGANRIYCLNVDADPDDLPDPVTAVVDLPAACVAITYDDLTDRVLVLSPENRRLYEYDDGLPSFLPVDEQPIPTTVPLGTVGYLAVNPIDGDAWFTTVASTSIYNVKPGSFPTSPPIVTTIDVPGAQFVLGISFDDAGHLFVSADGGVVELAKNGQDQWVEVTTPYFGALPSGPRIQVSRSRTNYDPEIHSGPEWGNVDPDERIEGVVVVDCDGDFDDDRDVDVVDLLGVVGAWGPCDVCLYDTDGDRVIGVEDLLMVLAAWGPCPP
jgi:hypothetical protein